MKDDIPQEPESELLLRTSPDGEMPLDIRLQQLGQVVRLMRRAADRLDARQVLDVIEHYSCGLNLLDAHDHQCLTRPAGSSDCYVLSYDECRRLIAASKACLTAKSISDAAAYYGWQRFCVCILNCADN